MTTDAVITWVDGADPLHKQRLDAHLASLGQRRPPSASPTRFHDAGEIDYCVGSIMRHAPWFRNIYIVTDAQTPAMMRHVREGEWAGRVQVVDHREIFAGFEQHLPTFNSRSIISLLWKIPGLAEQFVYFNDDFMLLRPVRETDFFRDGRIVLRGKWRLQSSHSATRRLARVWKDLRGGPASIDAAKDEASARDAQEAGARMVGLQRRYYRLYHNPYPFRRSTLEGFFAQHPQLLQSNLVHRLRSSHQFKLESLASHLEIAQDTAILDNHLRTVQVKPGAQPAARIRYKMWRADHAARDAFACVQSLDRADDGLRGDILEWLDRRAGRLAMPSR